MLLPVLATAVACGSADETFVNQLEAPVVYGSDDRLEVYAHPNADLRDIAQQSIVALVPNSQIDALILSSHGASLSEASYKSLKYERGLCDDEPFGDQPVAASCSGTLIGDDLVLTAGHCLSATRPCTAFTYVFDYFLSGPDLLERIDAEDVYTCSEVVMELDSPATSLTPDFAVVRLDRPVEGNREPVAIRADRPLDRGDGVAMIGFGSGLPAKIDAGATVADPRLSQRDFFVVNLDAFEGHSGSAIFDSQSRLAGILLGGRVPDYVVAQGESCARANVFDDSEAGEIAHNIAPIIGALCDEGVADEALCAPDACEGEPCGIPPDPSPSGPGVGGVVAANGSSGCSASRRSDAAARVWLFPLMALLLLRVRRKAA